MRDFCARWIERVLASRAQVLDGDWVRKSALVISPHPDDESLACGGMIIRKINHGARVDILFLTDGSRSHPWVDSTRLGEMRRAEARRAGRVLGVPDDHIHFVGLQDGGLTRAEAPATAAVSAILARCKPRQVFAPHRADVFADHMAANRIGGAAVKASGLPIEFYEYPIWLWRHWPWVVPARKGVRPLMGFWGRTLQRLPALIRDCEYRLDVRDVAAQKKAAILEHKSQMDPLDGPPGCPLLSRVDAGGFLELFLRGDEYFCRRR